jgi:hypothetical protein
LLLEMMMCALVLQLFNANVAQCNCVVVLLLIDWWRML